MQISLKVTDTVGELQKIILIEIGKVLDDAIVGAVPNIKTRVGEFVRQLVINTPEYSSLINGKLNKDLGIEDPVPALNQILDALSQGVTVEYSGLKISSSSVSGGFVVGLVKDKFSELTSLSGVRYMSGSHEIPWLEWLLFSGDSMIITDHRVKYVYSTRSRTYSALMVNGSSGWRVPPEFSGTENNNFITRAFTDDPSTEKVIGKIIEDEITRRLP